MKILIPISVGELLDKISILQIKSKHTDSPYVTKELEYLTDVAQENGVYDESELNKLLEVNTKLWDIEDKLRELEKSGVFDDDFIHNARMVYITNDERSRIKKEINQHTNSELVEVKLYK